MSLSTALAAGGRPPRKDSRSVPRMRPNAPGPRQPSGSEEELAMRQHRRNAKASCCVICSLTAITLTTALVLNVCMDTLSHHWT